MKIADNSLRKLQSTNSQRSNQQHLKAMSKDSAHHQGGDELAESPPDEPLAMSESTSYAAPADASNVESSARSASDRRRDFAASQTGAASTECELDKSSMSALRRKRLSFQVAAGNELILRRPLAAKSPAATSYDRWASYMRHPNALSAHLASHDSASVLSERLEARAASNLISSIGMDFLRLEGALQNRPPLCPPGANATSGTTKLLLPADYSTVLYCMGSATGRAAPLNKNNNFIMRLAPPPKFLE